MDSVAKGLMEIDGDDDGGGRAGNICGRSDDACGGRRCNES